MIREQRVGGGTRGKVAERVFRERRSCLARTDVAARGNARVCPASAAARESARQSVLSLLPALVLHVEEHYPLLLTLCVVYARSGRPAADDRRECCRCWTTLARCRRRSSPPAHPCPPTEFGLDTNFLLLLLFPATPHGCSGPFREGFRGRGGQGCWQARVEKRQQQRRRRRQRHPMRDHRIAVGCVEHTHSLSLSLSPLSISICISLLVSLQPDI